jgi:hypothetical protein
MRVLRGLVATSVLVLGAMAQERSADAVRRVLDAHGCQTDLPGDGDGAGTGTGDAGRRRAARRDRSSVSFEVGQGSAVFAEVLLWVVVGAAVVVLLAAILRGAGVAAPEPGNAPKKKVVAGSAETPATDAEVLPDHARLAAVGEFAAALRALLLRAFHVAHGGAANVPLHTTARELLRRVRAERAAVEPLAGLVATVERVHFGGRPADRALYDASCAQFAAWESRWRAESKTEGSA